MEQFFCDPKFWGWALIALHIHIHACLDRGEISNSKGCVMKQCHCDPEIWGRALITMLLYIHACVIVYM